MVNAGKALPQLSVNKMLTNVKGIKDTGYHLFKK
jgi:hypothetical protein